MRLLPLWSSRSAQLLAFFKIFFGAARRVELGERGEALSGNKAWLRRRLHAAKVSEYLESAAGAAGE